MKYWDRVKVTSWFYEWQIGIVKDLWNLLEIHRVDWKIDLIQEYGVSLTSLWEEEVKYEMFRESSLELIK